MQKKFLFRNLLSIDQQIASRVANQITAFALVLA